MKAYEKLRSAIAEALNQDMGRGIGEYTISSAEVIAVELAVTEALPHILAVLRGRYGQVRLLIEDGRVTYVLPEFSHKVTWK